MTTLPPGLVHAPDASGALARRQAATPGLALLIAGVGALTVLTVWVLEHAGYVPCELCLAERNPYYLGVPLALVTAWAARTGRLRPAATGFALLGVLFLASAALAAYHAGVEWRFWAGPTQCAGPLTTPTSVTDMMAALRHDVPVRCDAPALVLFGLSLAGWNVLVSLLLCGLAILGARACWRGAPPSA